MVFVPVVAIQDVKVELPPFFVEALNGKVVDAPTLETPDDSPANDEREDSCAVSVQPSSYFATFSSQQCDYFSDFW